MKSFNSKYWCASPTLFVLLTTSSILLAEESREKGFGLRPISQETIDHVEENWPTIIDVAPNKIGSERIQHHKKENNQPIHFAAPAHHEEEFTTVIGKQQHHKLRAVSEEKTKAALPRSVDNSKLPSFPPIGDQQNLGSCVAWGSTYYQATHEYGLLNGINNKNSLDHVFSPKWTYNNLNEGFDEGLDIFSTYQLLSQNGIVEITSFPYDANYLEWDLKTQDWISALSHRMQPGQLVTGIGGATQNLDVIKQILNNGHVLTFGTFISSWVYDKVKVDPAAATNPHAGELAASWQNGSEGGHCMTIVGYNDDIWIDINKNGKVDPGEKGAFLVANSWSTEWGNKGFVWIAYDAFLSTSKVVNGPSKNRVAIADAMDSKVVTAVPLAKGYTPKLVAEFSLSQSVRNQISVAVGVSDTSSTIPSKTFQSYALKNQGGNFEFDGTKAGSIQTATFAVDLTDLLPDNANPNRYYLIVNDSQIGKPTTVNSFKVVDLVHNKTVSSTKTPLTCDRSQALAYVDYAFAEGSTPTPAPVPTPPAPSTPTVSITAPTSNQVVGGLVWITANAKDKTGIASVEFYVDGILCSVDKVAPYQILLDTKGLPRGKHTITVIARNSSQAYATSSIDFYVRSVKSMK